MRLDLLNRTCLDPAHPRYLFLPPAALQLVEPGQLALVGCDDQLPVPAGLDPVFVAVRVEQRGPLDPEPRLQPPGRVVDPGVERGSRVGGRVAGKPILALQDAEARVAVTGEQLAGDRQSED